MNQGISSARVTVRPAEFAGIDRACTEFLRVIAQVRALAADIGAQVRWGLGEDSARLISGPVLVARLRATADGPGHSVGAVLDAHARVVGEIQQAHRIARARLVLADEEWAEHLRSAEMPVGQHGSTPAEAGR
ncbi:hypothetical protein ACFXK0_22980 [Nocardia sp. NPDC059177]|uniref:hypothetical protein n=1 Tax=Nocardia sp. NPDC059177 TaxID=3346759 RepID=UPI003695FC01